MKRRFVTATALIGAASMLMAACSQGGSASSEAGTSLTLRLWDDQAAQAYEAALPAFTEETGITVNVEVVPWSDYFTGLRSELAAGTGPDVFWSNTNNYTEYARGGKIVNIDEEFPASERDGWLQGAIDQYTVDGKLYGVPVLTDPSIAVYYNKSLLDAAGVSIDDLQNLSWDPNASTDSLREITRKLTLDSSGRNAADPAFDADHIVQYGYNAALDGQAMLIPYLGSAGATCRMRAVALRLRAPRVTPRSATWWTSSTRSTWPPSAADTNDNGDFSRDQFLQGKIALFQSGAYNLANVAEGASFEWGLAPQPKGPAGAVTVGNSVVAAGSTASANPEAQHKLLAWLAGKDGGAALGKTGAGFPANEKAQATWTAYWSDKGVDTSVMAKTPSGTIMAPFGAKLGAAMDAYNGVLKEVFLGRTGVHEGVQAAQDAANAAIDQ